jgi:glycosyltransferase involved in cell wall biosynthesis
MKTNIEDLFRDLEMIDEPAAPATLLRLTNAAPVESDIADTFIEDAAPLLRLTPREDGHVWHEQPAPRGELPAVIHRAVRHRQTHPSGGAPATHVTDGPRIFSPFLATAPSNRIDRPTVLHVRVVAGTGGGPEKTILRSPRYACDEYFRMAVAYIHPTGDPGIETIKASAKQFNAPLFTIPERGPLDPRTVAALYLLCKSQKVAVWHGHDYKSNLLGLVLRRFWKMKLVTTVHGWTNDTFRTRMYYHVDKWCLPRYDEVIAVSPLLNEHCLNIGVRPSRLSYIANAIDCNDYKRTRTIRQARAELGIFRDSFIMGVVARLSPEKGVDRAIGAIADLHVKYPNTELHIVGDGPEFDRLKRLAVERGVAGIVHFWGHQAQSKRFFEMFDMLLLPSLSEGFPNVVLEAMAMAVPVAAANVGGVSELLKQGRRGVILDANDVESWAGHIAPLIVSKERRHELARLGRARVEKYYSFDQRMAKVFKVYDRAMSIESQRERGEWRRAA